MQGPVVPGVVASRGDGAHAQVMDDEQRGKFRKRIGRLFKEARLGRKLTLEDVSEKIGKTFGQVGHYENGRRPIWLEDALVLAQELQLDPARLLSGGKENVVTLGEEELRLIEGFRRLPLDDRNKYLQRIEGLAKLYGEPVADERLPAVFREAPNHPPPSRRTTKTPK